MPPFGVFFLTLGVFFLPLGVLRLGLGDARPLYPAEGVRSPAAVRVGENPRSTELGLADGDLDMDLEGLLPRIQLNSRRGLDSAWISRVSSRTLPDASSHARRIRYMPRVTLAWLESGIHLFDLSVYDNVGALIKVCGRGLFFCHRFIWTRRRCAVLGYLCTINCCPGPLHPVACSSHTPPKQTALMLADTSHAKV